MKINLILYTTHDNNDEQKFLINSLVIPRKGEVVWVSPDDAPIGLEDVTEENKHFGNPYTVDYVDYTFVDGKLNDVTVCAHLQRKGE